MNRENTELFETTPVRKAVLTMSVPMVISQAITIIYNVADTFFVGQLNRPDQVAAITLVLPLFYFLTALTNLFGIGGASVISGFLGRGDEISARKCAAFCIWTCIAVSFLYGILICSVRQRLFPLMGAGPEIYQYTCDYAFWTITFGAVPTVFNPMISNLIRAEGYSGQASFGVALGGILNILLDPLFNFVFDMEITGAAIATMLSAWLATAYFLCFLYRKRKAVVITMSPKYYTLQRSISVKTVLTGLPNFVISSMSTLSNAVLNPLVGAYSTAALAGMGIAKKIDLLSFAIAQGMAQGTLPLISYNFASGNRKRMMQIIKSTLIYGLAIAVCGMALLLLFAAPLSKFFIADTATASYSKYFIQVISLAAPSTTLILLIISVFQATQKKVQPLVISALRKGILDIPLMLILGRLLLLNGIVWAIPSADICALIIAFLMFIPHFSRLRRSCS